MLLCGAEPTPFRLLIHTCRWLNKLGSPMFRCGSLGLILFSDHENMQSLREREPC